jgi:hypothetical protein
MSRIEIVGPERGTFYRAGGTVRLVEMTRSLVDEPLEDEEPRRSARRRRAEPPRPHDYLARDYLEEA